VGSDVVDEFAYADLYAPVDLDIGHCRLSVAEPVERNPDDATASHLRVASNIPTSRASTSSASAFRPRSSS
jgi:ATP phosphoribosyltransferase